MKIRFGTIKFDVRTLLSGGDRLQEGKVAKEPPLNRAAVYANTAGTRLFFLQCRQLFEELRAQVAAPLLFYLCN